MAESSSIGAEVKGNHFGERLMFCEPHWYQGAPSPYYDDSHRELRAKVRAFVETELKPNVDEWIRTGYPVSLHKKAYEAGIFGLMYPAEYGGHPDMDPFHELIVCDELARMGGGGVLTQLSINSMALPPILLAGSQYLKDKVCRAVITGEKCISLAISEPTAGSDVANIQTTAVKDGDFYLVNGTKKWITGGLMADFFTVAVRTGGPGMGGISLLLLEREMPGIHIRKMETQADTAHNTTFITLENVRVPVTHLIGPENNGFPLIVVNFNHERFVISAGALRSARLCFEQALKFAMVRKTFGKPLVSHQLIRYKLAEMARQIEANHDFLERVAYQFKTGHNNAKLGATCALLKVQTSKTFEFCAREASQIFGGSSVVREGRGKIVERLYREVRAVAIPGGSEEILLDFAVRVAVAKAKKRKSRL